MKKSVLALVAFTAGFLIQFPARVFADPAGDVQVAMQLFKLKAPSRQLSWPSSVCRPSRVSLARTQRRVPRLQQWLTTTANQDRSQRRIAKRSQAILPGRLEPAILA